MSSPFVGEIRMFAGNFAPVGWSFCDGSVIPISQNDVLFALIGTTYGGDGVTTFNLPDLQSRVPIHMGTGPGGAYALGQQAGVETVTLTTQQIPAHSHVPLAAGSGTSNSPANKTWANWTGAQFSDQVAPAGLSPLAPAALSPSGGSQPHDNLAPFLAINFILSQFGVFPTQA